MNSLRSTPGSAAPAGEPSKHGMSTATPAIKHPGTAHPLRYNGRLMATPSRQGEMSDNLC
jgi:hypothetical protein